MTDRNRLQNYYERDKSYSRDRSQKHYEKIKSTEWTNHQGITKIIMNESIIHFRTMEIGENIKRVIKTSIWKKNHKYKRRSRNYYENVY